MQKVYDVNNVVIDVWDGGMQQTSVDTVFATANPKCMDIIACLSPDRTASATEPSPSRMIRNVPRASERNARSTNIVDSTLRMIRGRHQEASARE